jgi:acyl transferase domain-containing protein
MNLAGGVSLQASRNEAFFYQEGGIGAFDGHCRAFDARAGGTVSGSGLGIVVLKRLDDAIRDGDTIHALIRGSAINNDGAVKLSYTAPSIDGQAEVIGEALSVSGVDPATISYVECHGTGTALGDPVEIAGLTKAFRAFTDKKGYCAVGSVKTNIGHLVTAGGVASMIKTILALKNRQIPPSLNFEKPNPKIDFENSPFFVVDQLRPWQTEADLPRRAGVSSFGIGGTNAHLILEEAPSQPAADDGGSQIIPLSGRTEEALNQVTANLADFLEAEPATSLADVAYTLQVGRKGFGYRRFVLARSTDEAVAALRAGTAPPPFCDDTNRKAVFMFPGQGAQYAGMSAGLYQHLSLFRELIDHCAERLQPSLELDIRDLLFPKETQAQAATEKLTQTRYTQPALFTVEYALARQLMAWGLEPDAMIGHSIGEYVAACLAGVFELDDALDLVAERGRLIQSLPAGDMLAVPLAEREITPHLNDELSLATINGPQNCVVSGTAAAIEAFAATMAARGCQCRPLHTSHAFHSHMMEPMLESFTQRVAATTRQPPQLRYISNVTGTWITAEEATDPAYYARHLRHAVRFGEGLATLFKEHGPLLLEVGPGRTLSGLAKQQRSTEKPAPAFQTMRHPREKRDDVLTLQQAIGNLWQQGAALDWAALHRERQPRRIPLPTYPFQRRRYWIEPDMDRSGQVVQAVERQAGIRKQNPRDWTYTATWKAAPLPAQIKPQLRQTWLLFIDGRGPGAGLARLLQDETQTVISVSAGSSFLRLDDGYYTINPTAVEDYSELLDDLKGRGIQPDHFINLFPLDLAARIPDGGPAARGERCFNELLCLLQALGGVDRTITLSALCDDPDGQGVGSAMRGVLRVAGQEMPQLRTRVINLKPPEPGSWQERQLLRQLLNEWLHDDPERVVAYVDNRRHVQDFAPLPLDEDPVPNPSPGTYLILGGVRGPGLEIAAHLAKRDGAELLLTSFDAFPEQDQWATLTDDHADRTEVTRLQAIAAAGTKLDVRQLEPSALAGLIAATPRLAGVVYAEGRYGRQSFRALNETSLDESLSHFQAKLPGLTALEDALGEREPAFCVVISSMSAILGGLGLAAMAATHGCVDAFVKRHNRTHPGQWVCMNWDGWVGLAGGEAAGSQAAKLALSMEEGMLLLDRIAGLQAVDQVAVSSEDLPARLRLINRGPEPEADSPEEKTYTVHPRPHLQNPYVEPRNDTERDIAAIWQSRLGIEKVGIHDNFFDLGGDSLIVVKIRNALKEKFAKDLLTSDLFEYPTVATQAVYFSEDQQTESISKAKNRAQKRRSAMEQGNMEGLFKKRRKRSNG